MLWISLYINDLPLQIIQRCFDESLALVIADGPQNRPIVVAANEAARRKGVTRGIATAAANALASNLTIVHRDIDKETEALYSLACWASQFTPSVTIQTPNVILLEVASTLTMHKGLSSLLERLNEGLTSLGYVASMGIAPTPVAAWLLSKAKRKNQAIQVCTQLDNLPTWLDDLSLSLFDWPLKTIRDLDTLGISTIHQCIKSLPRDGFIQRFGDVPLKDIDRAFGRLPDPRDFFIPPETFSSSLDFGFEINDAMALLFPLKRLLIEMEGFLRARGAGVVEWHIDIVHGKKLTQLTIGVATSERDPAQLLMLAKERLAQEALPASVIGLRLRAERLIPFDQENSSWLPDQPQQSSQWFQFIDRLRAKLGHNNVFYIGSVDDHRPEAASRKLSTFTKEVAVPCPVQPRPSFLLTTPRPLLSNDSGPLCSGRLDFLTPPESIEVGWWQGLQIIRNYYVAQNPYGEKLWVFQERDNKQWYLHGYYS